MYNGPSGPRILLTIETSPARATVAANIAPMAKQITLLTFIGFLSERSTYVQPPARSCGELELASSPLTQRAKSSEKPGPISSQTSLNPGDCMYFVIYRTYGRQCASGMSPKSW